MTAGETSISGPGTPWPQPVELLRDLVDDLHTPNVAQGLAHRGVAGEDGGFKGLREGDIATVIESRIVLDRKLERRLNQAVELAKRIRSSGVAVTERWSDAELKLGVGVGAASGYVTVGVIGAASRLEYTAVGPTVNLAARLCAEALHGEILVDPRTIALLGAAVESGELIPGEALTLKGFPLPVQSYVLAAAA